VYLCSSLVTLQFDCVLCSVQNAIAGHESNGLDIIIALVLNDINPLGKYRIDLVLGLKVKMVSFRGFIMLLKCSCVVIYTATVHLCLIVLNELFCEILGMRAV